jgi:transposase
MLSFCGIDVSKDRLDVMVLPEEQCCSVPNDAGGWAALVERLRNFSVAAIGLEASGGYERGVARALLAGGSRYARSIRSSCGSSPGRAGYSQSCS